MVFEESLNLSSMSFVHMVRFRFGANVVFLYRVVLVENVLVCGEACWSDVERLTKLTFVGAQQLPLGVATKRLRA